MLINPSTLYSGGNVKLDSTPYLRIALQERARKDMRGQAIDQYYQKLPETINDKGVRDQEVPLIADIKNKMTETWLNNRDAIKRGDPAATLKMNQLLREGLAITRSSQNATKNNMKLGRIALDKNNQSLLNNDGFVQRHALSDLPVNHSDYKPLNLTEELANRPFDQQAYVKEIKNNFKYGEGIPTITPHPTDKNLEVVTTNPVLDDQTKQSLYASSAYKLHNDVAFQRQLQKDFSTPEQIAPLNEVSKKVFGHEIKEPEDIAAAYTASLLPSSTVRQSVRANIDAANKVREDAATLAFQRRKELASFNSNLIQGRKTADGTLEGAIGFPTDEINNRYGEDKTLYKKDGTELHKRIVYVDKIPSTILNTINPTDVNKQIYAVEPLVNTEKDGTYRSYYEVDSDGNLIGKEGKKIGRNDAQALYIDKFGNTKVKVAHGNQGLITTPTQTKPAAKKQGKFDNL